MCNYRQKNILIIIFLFLFVPAFFASDTEIKLLKSSYEQLASDLLECKKEALRIDVPDTNLADHLALRERIEQLAKERERLKALLDDIIIKEKSSSKAEDKAVTEEDKPSGKNKKPSKGEKPKGTQAATDKSTQGAKESKPDKNSSEKKLEVKGKGAIVFSKKVVKPGNTVIYTVVPPKHYLQPQVVWIKCSSNLNTINGAPMKKALSDYLVADSLITRQQNASVTALIRDAATPGLYEKITANVIISAYIQEQKIELQISSRMVSGRSYNFLITVPPEFKPPFSILVKSSSSKHLIVYSNTTSLAGSIKAWGNGNPKVILSGSVSARVYDDSGKIGYVNKLVSIDEPTKEELEKIPMEQPPTWYEEAATYTWKATKATLKTTGQVMQAFADAEAKHGYLKNAMKQPANTSQPGKTPIKYRPPPRPKPTWMTDKHGNWVNANAQKAKEPKTYRIAVTCSHPGYIAPGWGGAKLGTFTVTKMRSAKYSIPLPIRSAPLKSSKIISENLYIENTSRNMAAINSVKTKFEKVYSQYAKGKVWERYSKSKKNYQQISKSSFGPFIVPDF